MTITTLVVTVCLAALPIKSKQPVCNQVKLPINGGKSVCLAHARRALVPFISRFKQYNIPKWHCTRSKMR